MTKAGYACNLILYAQKVTGFATQKRDSMKDKLPAVRCTQSYKKKVMRQAIEKNGSYAQYITTLINTDLQIESEINFTRPKGKQKYSEVSITIPGDLKRHLELVREKTNVSISEQVRKELMKANGARELEIDEITTLMQTNNLLIALGRNLNQLTRRANANMAVEIPKELINELIKTVNDTSVEIHSLIDNLGI